MAGWRDEREYLSAQAYVDRWPENARVKKLVRKKDMSTFYYYDQARECRDCEVHRVKIYRYADDDVY